MAKIIACVDCCEAKKHYAKGLCKLCYDYRWRKENPDRRRANDRRYWVRHRNEILARNREYQRRHYEELKEGARLRKQRWREKNPERAKSAVARRRARKASLPDTLTIEQAKQKLLIPNCFYCEAPIENLTLDHFVPISRGGGTTLANSVACCLSCNASKQDKMPGQILMQLSLGE